MTGGKGLLGSAFIRHIRDAGGTAVCADITAKDALIAARSAFPVLFCAIKMHDRRKGVHPGRFVR